ncbi:hypothetical protein BJF90_38380 [Pseudonocardia sp. CNS-004]|nr:hypothetical protein BJF90_38380 [Pseudonocardia sp. CNS-004]
MRAPKFLCEGQFVHSTARRTPGMDAPHVETPRLVVRRELIAAGWTDHAARFRDMADTHDHTRITLKDAT